MKESRIARARSELGVTAEEAAQEMGLDPEEYKRIEAGGSPSSKAWGAITTYLGLSKRESRRGPAEKYDVGGGRRLTALEIAEEAGISKGIAYKRVRDGITGAALLTPRGGRAPAPVSKTSRPQPTTGDPVARSISVPYLVTLSVSSVGGLARLMTTCESLGVVVETVTRKD